MHGPAEHKVEGMQHDLEIHIVHSLVDGPDYKNYHDKFAVIGLLFQIADQSHPVLDQMKLTDRTTVSSLNLSELFV